VQRETLDNLAEAVAVFGSNGRAQLFNPAFAKMWKLSAEALREQPHIETVEAWCRPLFDDALTWRTLREAITAIENRVEVPLKLERKDGSVLDCMTMPLPDGATMLTFQDITDTENVERALRERTRGAGDRRPDEGRFRPPRFLRIALAADHHHRLRPSSDRPRHRPAGAQRRRNISTTSRLRPIRCSPSSTTSSISPPSTPAAMTLELGPVDIRKAISDAAEGIQDRLARDRITLKVDLDPNIGSFVGDGSRVVQVLYNLLANAVGFSPQDATIKLSAMRTEHNVVFAVTDRGPGIPADVKDKVFDWFESHSTARGIAAPASACRW